MEKDNTIQIENNSALPTQEEYKTHIKKIEDSFFGSIFPIAGAEVPRVLLATLTYFLVGLTYSFMRQFKDRVVFAVLGSPGAANWLKIIVFFGSVAVINVVTNLFMKYGIKRGTDIYIIGMAVVLVVYCIPIFFKDYLNPLGWSENLTNGAVFSIRRLSILTDILKLFNHCILVMFYVLSEVLGSTLMSFVFMTYLNDNLTPFQMGRYLRPIYIGANLSLLLSGSIVKALVGLTDKYVIYSVNYREYCCAFIAVAAVLGVIYAMKFKLDSYFSTQLYQLKDEVKKKKSKAKVSISDTILLLGKSSLLLSLTIMSLAYNFITSLASVHANYVYSAYATYLKENPAANQQAGLKPDSKTIGAIYKASESQWLAAIVIFLMLSPTFALLFKKFGVFLFGFITLAFCEFSGLSSFYFAAINFPYTNQNKPVLGGFRFGSGDEPKFGTEAFVAAANNLLIKVGKYAFYDTIKENVSCRIDPENRALYKGVFDGVAAKAGKMFGAFYGLILESVLNTKDARYYTLLTAIVVSVICVGWFFSLVYLHPNYNYAVENNTFLYDGSKPVNKK